MAVYFIENPERRSVKIGTAADPEKRLATLQTASPDPLKIIAVFPGGVVEEKELHRRFESHRLRGEWFLFADEIKAYLRDQAGEFSPEPAPTHGLRWVMSTGPGPEWLRCAAMSEDGTVFVPAAMGGSEESAFFCASFDCIPVVMDEGHLYVPADWMAEHRPEYSDICAAISRKVQGHLGHERN